jgi:hypothetical protein
MLLGAAAIAGVASWYFFRPERLFVDRVVMESFTTVEQSAMEMAPGAGAMGEGPAMADAPVMLQSESPTALASGRFHSNAHETSGLATIFRLPDGRRVLRLTAFATSNGPDVRVYLVAASDVNDEDAAKEAGFVDLGELKGNIGDQSYEVPPTLDLTRYRAVSIWCRRFSANFGAAPLEAI